MKFFEYIDKPDIEKMHEATLQVLEQTGIRSVSTRFLEAAASVGLTVKEERIYFPRELVAKGLASAPSHFSIYGRDDKYEIKWGEKRAYNHTCVGTPFLKDVDTNIKRDVLLEDLENFIRVADALPDTDIVSCIFPQDVPAHAVVTIQTAAMLKNTSKPLRICIESAHESSHIFDALAAASGGRDELRKKPIAYIEISAVSPLDYADGPANGLLDIVEAGLPLGLIPCPMMGATGPMTLIGSVVMHNAEIVAGVVLAQLLSPGHPTIMSPRVTFMDMKTGLGLWAAPEMGLAAAASAQMAMYYKIPCTVTGFSCSSKTSDEQAAFESMFNTLLPSLCGVDVVGASGSLDNALVSCYRKLILDDEISSLVHRALRGNEVTEDTMAVKVIDEAVKGKGNFLAHKHTIKHLRTELWKPTLCDRGSYEHWEATGTTFGERAQEMAKSLLAEHRPKPLTDEELKNLEGVVKTAIDAR